MKQLLLCCTVFLFSLVQPILADEEIGISEEQSASSPQDAVRNDTSASPVVQENQQPSSLAVDSTTPDTRTPVSTGIGTIIITTSPDCATIDINGTNLGITPWNRTGFIPGFYRITLEKEGYHRFQKTVEIRPGDTIRILHDFTGSATVPQESSAVSTTESLSTDSSASGTEEPEQPKRPAGGTIVIACSTDSANVVVNKVKVGVTPFSRKGFRAGWYEVELKKSGYEPFRQMVKVEDDSTVRIDAEMEPFFGRLMVMSTPDKANVLINDVLCGTTPYDSTGIKPNTYRIRLEREHYVPWTTQQTIRKNRTDTLNVELISIAVRDSLRKVHSRRFKLARRIVFGSLTVGFLGAGMYYNSRADQQLTTEREAWDSYMEANLSTGEYDTRYARYEDAAETTDLFFKRRNAMYVLSGIFCVGLAISIPF